MLECPVGGCSHEEATYRSLVGHMVGKADEPHQGIGFNRAEAMLKAHGITEPEPEPEQEDGQADYHQGNEPSSSPGEQGSPQGLSPEEAYARGATRAREGQAGGSPPARAGGEAGGTPPGRAQATDGGVVPQEERHDPSDDHRADHSGGRVDPSDDHHDAQEEYVECPRCESDKIVFASQYLGRFREEVETDTTALLRESDFVCWKCGGVFDA